MAVAGALAIRCQSRGCGEEFLECWFFTAVSSERAVAAGEWLSLEVVLPLMSQVTDSGDPSVVLEPGAGCSSRHRPMDITLDCYRCSEHGVVTPDCVPAFFLRELHINSHGYTCSAMWFFFFFFLKGKQCFVALFSPIALTEVRGQILNNEKNYRYYTTYVTRAAAPPTSTV